MKKKDFLGLERWNRGMQKRRFWWYCSDGMSGLEWFILEFFLWSSLIHIIKLDIFFNIFRNYIQQKYRIWYNFFKIMFVSLNINKIIFDLLIAIYTTHIFICDIWIYLNRSLIESESIYHFKYYLECISYKVID